MPTGLGKKPCQGFAQYRYPPYLLCARELVKAMHFVPGHQEAVQQLLIGLTQSTMALASSLGPAGLIEEDDVFNEYLTFVEMYVVNCPTMLLGRPEAPQEAVLPAIMQFTAAAMRHLDGDSVEGALLLIRAIVETLADDCPPSYRAAVEHLLNGARVVVVWGGGGEGALDLPAGRPRGRAKIC